MIALQRRTVMRTLRTIALVGGSALMSLLASCSGEDPIGPPQVRLGRDECVECGMAIAEDRCSAAVLVEDEDGRRHLHFDDIGCLLDWERQVASEAEPPRILGRFVHDYGSRAWCAAENAGYLDGASVRTPMASGLLGFESRDAAERAHASHGGRVRLWGELPAARLVWLEHRDQAMREAARSRSSEPPSAEPDASDISESAGSGGSPEVERESGAPK